MTFSMWIPSRFERRRLLMVYLALLRTAAVLCDLPLTDHCLNESFNASCTDGRLVLVTEARFGRMRPGRCIGGAFNIGCSKDIKSHLDALCSAKPRCDVSVRDLVDLHPCQRDFVSYLEASYICIEVSGLNDNECPPSGHVRHHANQDGYLVWAIGGKPSDANLVGTEHCPWTIFVDQGQRVDLSIVVVLASSGASSCVTEIVAEQPGLITTKNHPIFRANVCSMVSGNQSKRHLLVSTGNMLQVYIKSPPHAGVNSASTVLLHYAAVGCAIPLQLPENAVMERVIGDPDRLVVRCNRTVAESTWYLTCHGGRWLGIKDLNNCTVATTTSNNSNVTAVTTDVTIPETRRSSSARQHKLTAGLAWAVAVGVLLGMFAGLFLLLSVHCIQRAMYTASATASPSCDEVTSQSEERYSFWRQSNRFSDYHTQTSHELMTSQQQRRCETNVTLTTGHRFKCSLLHCILCLQCNQHKDPVVSVDRNAADASISRAQSPENGIADKRHSHHPHRGRKIARTTADCNNSGAWRPDTAALLTTGRETYIAATTAVPDTAATPPLHHCDDTTATPPRHRHDTATTPPRHRHYTTATTPLRHRRDTTMTPPRHRRDTAITPLRRHYCDNAATPP